MSRINNRSREHLGLLCLNWIAKTRECCPEVRACMYVCVCMFEVASHAPLCLQCYDLNTFKDIHKWPPLFSQWLFSQASICTTSPCVCLSRSLAPTMHVYNTTWRGFFPPQSYSLWHSSGISETEREERKKSGDTRLSEAGSERKCLWCLTSLTSFSFSHPLSIMVHCGLENKIKKKSSAGKQEYFREG